MELIKDIYFNTDKLVEDTTVKVSYTGKFYQGNNEKVYLHYGYGKDWNNVNEIEMAKTDLGYQAELNLSGNDTLNFCFKNQNNEWDNNFGKNYIFDIEKKCNNIVGVTPGTTPEFGSNVGTPVGIPVDTTVGIPVGLGVEIPVGTPVEPNVYKVITPTYENSGVTNIDTVDKPEFNQIDTTLNVAKTVNTPTTNAIALAPTGFNYWTKKIKETVCKFFSYVPKLISGNYKRYISKNNNK